MTPRRRSSWEFGPGGSASIGFTASSSVFLGSAIVPTTPGLTLVRIRGHVLLGLTAATALGGFSGAIGIGLATSAAVTAGIASVPTPLTELGDENWLWHSFFSVRAPSATLSDWTDAAMVRILIDSKSMRKFDEGMSIYAAIEVVEEGTSVMRVDLDSRALALLP